MPERNNIPRVLGIAALAMMLGASTVYAQSSTATSSGKEAAGTSTQNKSGQSASSGATSTSGQTASSGKGVSRSDMELMRELAYANLSEIEAAKLAQSQSKNEQVKNFAQRMMDDHGNAMQELQQLAQQKGVTLPTELDAKHKAEAKKLSSLSGDKFDKQYMSQGGLADHRNTHRLLTRVQDRAADPDLKALAAKMTPVVDQHLTMAQSIASGKSTSNMSGSSMGPAGTSGTSSGTAGAKPSGASGTSGTSGSSNSVSPSK